MALTLKPPLPPMEARSVEEIPSDDGWQYEPKWDGFRCLAFRDGSEIFLQSKAGQPLARYFPDVVRVIGQLTAKKFVFDGELVIPVEGALSFDQLQLRLHPAASRVQKLATAHPAIFVVFDLLADKNGKSLLGLPLRERRQLLEEFAAKYFPNEKQIRLSPVTNQLRKARNWFEKVGGSLDGIVAKRLESPYASGERTAAVKIKRIRTVDCVVGGFRYASGTRLVGSLLLGLYDEGGLLHHVGFTSAFTKEEKPGLTKTFETLRKPVGFTGNAPGGPSRWSTERSGQWEPVDPKVVVEVTYDHFTGGRFRHGTKNRALAQRQGAKPMHTRSGRAPRRKVARAALELPVRKCRQTLQTLPTSVAASPAGRRLPWLSRPARFSDSPEPVKDLILSAADRVQHEKRAPFRKIKCRESAPQAGSCPVARVCVPPFAKSITAIWNSPPLRTLKATFFHPVTSSARCNNRVRSNSTGRSRQTPKSEKAAVNGLHQRNK